MEPTRTNSDDSAGSVAQQFQSCPRISRVVGSVGSIPLLALLILRIATQKYMEPSPLCHFSITLGTLFYHYIPVSALYFSPSSAVVGGLFATNDFSLSCSGLASVAELCFCDTLDSVPPYVSAICSEGHRKSLQGTVVTGEVCPPRVLSLNTASADVSTPAALLLLLLLCYP